MANAKSLLELCKRAELAWKKGSELERLALIKRLLSNPRLEGATLCYDLKKPFKKLLEIKKNDDSSKWCPARDLNPHACALDPKSSVSANFTSGACGIYIMSERVFCNLERALGWRALFLYPSRYGLTTPHSLGRHLIQKDHR